MTSPEPNIFTADVPPALLTGDSVRVDFALDKTIPPDVDKRELGVVATSVGITAQIMVESPRINTRISLGNAIWWLVPIVFLFVLYADGLQTWFAQDDFAWLSLLRDVHSFHDVIHALFAPAAQGTIRPWSERGFFLLFESLFGLDSLPFRICVFVTMAADLTLVAWITRRITGSSAAGAFAAMLWTANTALVTVMSWSSSYNEALCSLFLLGALALFIRYTETGRTPVVVVATGGFHPGFRGTRDQCGLSGARRRLCSVRLYRPKNGGGF